MSYSPADAITYLVDPGALAHLVQACHDSPGQVALIGFNEYSKNLINLVPGKVAIVYDRASWKDGIRFKEVNVTGKRRRYEVERLICCEYEYVYDYAASIISLYNNEIPYICPPSLSYKPTDLIKVFDQEAIYSSIAQDVDQRPPTMMQEEKMQLLMELLRHGLKYDGVVVEMGVWQGGSSWHLAKVLSYLGEKRPIYMIDLFESHALDRTATMCNDQISRQLAFYKPAQLIMGLVDDESVLQKLGKQKICFAHFDLGFIPKALEFLWERLSPGCALLLDNYGHLQGTPWRYDDMFAARNAHIIRLPWSEQGLVFKR